MFCLFQATMLFAELTYTLATEEAERIGVDHVARMTATGTGENSTGKINHFHSKVVFTNTVFFSFFFLQHPIKALISGLIFYYDNLK